MENRDGTQKLWSTDGMDGWCRAIVYVSCDPATLARDARALIDGGWKLTSAVMVDMFPYTAHLEAVCHFTRTC